MSWFRRTGQKIARIIKIAADPGAEVSRVIGYGKDVGGVPQFFARSPDFPRQVSGTECNIFDKPLTPHALDDEFDSTVLDPSWTWRAPVPVAGGINPYGNPGQVYELHTDRRPSWLMMQTDATNMALSKDITSLPADYFVWMRGSISYRSTANPLNNDATLTLNLSTTPIDFNNRVAIYLNESDAGSIQAEFLTVIGGVSTSIGETRDLYLAQALMQPVEAVGIQKIGNNYFGWVFGRGGTAVYMGTANTAIPVTSATIHTINASTAAPGTMITGVDFIRFKESSTFLP